MPVVKRAGMFTARHRAIMRCAKSRHTPCRVTSVSTAAVLVSELFETNSTWPCTQSRMACDAAIALREAAEFGRAKRLRRSDWQYRLG